MKNGEKKILCKGLSLIPYKTSFHESWNIEMSEEFVDSHELGMIKRYLPYDGWSKAFLCESWEIKDLVAGLLVDRYEEISVLVKTPRKNLDEVKLACRLPLPFDVGEVYKVEMRNGETTFSTLTGITSPDETLLLRFKSGFLLKTGFGGIIPLSKVKSINRVT